MIELIKRSSTSAEAKVALISRAWAPGMVSDMLSRSGAEASRPEFLKSEFGLREDGYYLSEAQAQAILELRLHRLTGLEQDKILTEFKEILDLIKGLIEILSSPDRLLEVIREELQQIKQDFGDERRSEVIDAQLDLSMEDLITEEDVLVTFSHEGYAKSQALSEYSTQKRGGRGKSATSMKEEDFIDKLFIANTHDTLLCFSSRGKAYWIKVYQLPQASRGSRGKPLVNLLPLEEGERINAVLPVRDYDEGYFIFMATSSGTVKKTPLPAFSNRRNGGIIAIDLRGDDTLVDVALTDGTQDIMLLASSGKAMRFNESTVRAMGRTAAGVRGIKMAEGQKVISLIVVDDSASILTATENGYGKRTAAVDYPSKGRGGQGVISIQASERNGAVVGAVQVTDQDEFMMISNAGTLIRTSVEDVRVMGRNTQGVRLIRLVEGEKLVEIERIELLGDGEDSPADATE